MQVKRARVERVEPPHLEMFYLPLEDWVGNMDVE